MNMNTLKFIASILVITNLFMSCGNTKDNKLKEQTEANSQKEHNQEHNQNHNSETLKLNNGEKWVVNEEMKPFILDAEGLLNQYISNQTEDYKTLATQLKEKNNGLIKSCTMNGESHDELHKWLYPHIELIESLSKAESTEAASEIVADLQASFSTYNQYFQ